tara:strand:- start:4588 stop:4863 length:276 start_codon:yes stop_codon:yes gene_type:complete
MTETNTIEHNALIATRVPPGDKWILVDDKKKIVYDTLTDALEAHFKHTGVACEFRLAPLDSKLYRILSHEEEIIPEEPKEFSMYGEFKQGA